jgi:hypothetical protein
LELFLRLLLLAPTILAIGLTTALSTFLATFLTTDFTDLAVFFSFLTAVFFDFLAAAIALLLKKEYGCQPTGIGPGSSVFQYYSRQVACQESNESKGNVGCGGIQAPGDVQNSGGDSFACPQGRSAIWRKGIAFYFSQVGSFVIFAVRYSVTAADEKSISNAGAARAAFDRLAIRSGH